MLYASVALIGCGSTDDGSTTAGDSPQPFPLQASTTITPVKLSRAQFVTQVNQICLDAWVSIRETLARESKHQDRALSRRRRFAETTRIPLMSGIDFHIFDGIRLLGAPKGEATEIEEIIGAMQEAVERTQRLGPLHSAAQIVARFSDYNGLARGYGLFDCLVDRAHLRLSFSSWH